MKIYVNGVAQAVEVAADAAGNTIRTTVPLKLGQRQQRRSRSTTSDCRTCGSTAARLPAGEVRQLAQRHAGRLPGRQAGRRAHRPEKRGAVRLVAVGARSGVSSSLTAELELAARTKRPSSSRARSPTSCRRRTRARRWPIILFRGEYDKRRDQVEADTPDVLPPMPGRPAAQPAGLRPWLLRPEHPLTARVTVNRFWQEVFGTGLVQHERRLRRQRRAAVASRAARLAGGRVPRVGLGREEVLQADRHLGDLSPGGRRSRRRSCEKDPQNRLLSRGPRFRMDAEMVRDYALAASGLLVREDRRAERQAVSARRRLGSGRHDRQQHPRLHAATAARTSIAAACTRSGSGLPRRPRWTSSTPPAAKSAPSAASGPTRRCRPW